MAETQIGYEFEWPDLAYKHMQGLLQKIHEVLFVFQCGGGGSAEVISGADGTLCFDE